MTPDSPEAHSEQVPSLADARAQLHQLANSVNLRIAGQSDVVENLIMGFCAGGHILLEGLPGLAKTTIVRLLAQGLGLPYGRVQMTSDIMPADILGSAILKPDLSGFLFQPGPIFTTVLLVDELNRSPAKVQSALLEAMQERQITAGSQTHMLDKLFWVVATQNPIDQEGTFPLAESQKDRFLMRLQVDYPGLKAESELMSELEEPLDSPLKPITLNSADLLSVRSAVRQIHCSPVLVEWATRIVQATREPSRLGLPDSVLWGVSPRGGRMWLRAARARAWWHGRNYVIPEDLRNLANNALGHRILTEWSGSIPTFNDSQDSLPIRLMNALGPP